MPGEEDVVRHFLESLVQEANAHAAVDEAEPEASEDTNDQEAVDEDGAMTSRFRAFASAEGTASATGER